MDDVFLFQPEDDNMARQAALANQLRGGDDVNIGSGTSTYYGLQKQKEMRGEKGNWLGAVSGFDKKGKPMVGPGSSGSSTPSIAGGGGMSGSGGGDLMMDTGTMYA